jgi:hypothetical protein
LTQYSGKNRLVFTDANRTFTDFCAVLHSPRHSRTTSQPQAGLRADGRQCFSALARRVAFPRHHAVAFDLPIPNHRCGGSAGIAKPSQDG